MSDVDVDLAVFLPGLAGGGAERAMVTLCNGFAQRGRRVSLVLGRVEGPYVGEVDRGVQLVDLNSRSVPAALLPLARFLRERRPRALLSAFAHANMVAIMGRGLARVPTRVVVSERNVLSEVVRRSPRRFVSLLPMAMRHIYHRADGIVAVSNGVADDLARTIGLPRERIEVVYNPVFTIDIPSRRVEPLPHPWFDAGAPPVILTAGRMIPAKDHLSLIDAFAKVRSRRECRLVILGEGPLRDRLEDLARGHGVAADLLMPGFQSNPFNWMHKARVFALSSRNEGLPGALIQAMACRTPVVSTDCPSGPAEILENGRWGRLVPVGDPAALAAAIEETLDESQHPDVERRAAAFSVDRALEGYARVLGIDL